MVDAGPGLVGAQLDARDPAQGPRAGLGDVGAGRLDHQAQGGPLLHLQALDAALVERSAAVSQRHLGFAVHPQAAPRLRQQHRSPALQVQAQGAAVELQAVGRLPGRQRGVGNPPLDPVPVLDRQVHDLLRRQVDLGVEQQPADGAVGPAGQHGRGQGQLDAVRPHQPHAAGIGERPRREGAAVGQRISSAGNRGGFLDAGLDRAGHGLPRKAGCGRLPHRRRRLPRGRGLSYNLAAVASPPHMPDDPPG